MRIKSVFLSCVFFLTFFSAFAQQDETVLGTRNLGFSGIWAGTKHQMTRYGNSNSYVYGWHFGLEFGKTLTIGLGAYDLRDNILWDNQSGQSFDMRWRVLSLGYGFQKYRAVHPIINIDAGPGTVKFANENEDRIFVIQPSAGVEINLLRWMHLAFEGGYRFVTDSNITLTDNQLSGVYGQATLRFGFSWGRYRNY
ncbi:MAG: hypothetical protein ACKVU2_17020 [Saprospiraceae bacterium]